MVRGISKNDAVAYIPEDDRGLPEEQQTVFHIKPKTGHESNIQTKHYMKGISEKPDGSRDMDVSKIDSADVANFQATVKKVENYAFPQDFYEDKEALKESSVKREIEDDLGNSEELWFTEEITDSVLLKKVAKTLPANVLREVAEVSEDMSRLKEGEKKS